VTLTIFLAVLAAAFLHAGWNALVKGSSDPLIGSAAIAVGAAVASALALPFVPFPAAASWPWLASAMVLQTCYYTLVGLSYGRADMSLVYPIMRGTAPMLVALAARPILGEVLPFWGWVGVGLISGGILSMALFGQRGARTGVGMALMTACVIAAYTLNDGHGARLSGSPIGYSLVESLLTAPPLLLMVRWRRGPGLGAALKAQALRGAVGGVGTLTSYTVALWAMSHAPIALVAALRETSILFATGISAFILKERVTAPRLLAVALIAAGAVALRMA